jgi:hypothetical protein
MLHNRDCKSNISLGNRDFIASTPPSRKFIRDLFIGKFIFDIYQGFLNRRALNMQVLEELMEEPDRN